MWKRPGEPRPTGNAALSTAPREIPKKPSVGLH